MTENKRKQQESTGQVSGQVRTRQEMTITTGSDRKQQKTTRNDRIQQERQETTGNNRKRQETTGKDRK